MHHVHQYTYSGFFQYLIYKSFPTEKKLILRNKIYYAYYKSLSMNLHYLINVNREMRSKKEYLKKSLYRILHHQHVLIESYMQASLQLLLPAHEVKKRHFLFRACKYANTHPKIPAKKLICMSHEEIVKGSLIPPPHNRGARKWRRQEQSAYHAKYISYLLFKKQVLLLRGRATVTIQLKKSLLFPFNLEKKNNFFFFSSRRRDANI